MADPKKIANNILDFLIDPTKIPVQQRLYIGPEEKLQNESYEAAKADAFKAYGDQKSNSDSYPSRNRTKKTTQRSSNMDRKSLIASFDILSKNFKENDPFSVDLRTMAAAVSQMSDEEIAVRVMAAKEEKCEGCGKDMDKCSCGDKEAKKGAKCEGCGEDMADCTCKEKEAKKEPPKPKECPKCGGPMYFGKCQKCNKKDEDEEEATASKQASDFWSKEASDLVAQTLVSDVVGSSNEEEEDEEEATAKVMKDEGEEEEEEATASKKKESEEETPPAAPKKDQKKKDAPAAEEEPAAEPVEEPVKTAKKQKEKPAVKNVEEEEGMAPESKIVDDSVLAYTYGGIEMGTGMVEAGEMSTEEKAKLAKLFE